MVRAATPQDAASLAELATQLGYPSTADAVRRRLQALMGSSNDAVLVAEVADRGVVGWVHVTVRQLVLGDRHAEIAGLVVHESCRRQGIGTELLRQAEAWAAARGCCQVRLGSATHRQAARAFYLSRGYLLLKEQRVFVRSLGSEAGESRAVTPEPDTRHPRSPRSR